MDMSDKLNRAAAVLTLAALVLSGLAPAAGHDSGRLVVYPYRDDFDQRSNWTVVQGTWRHHDGVYNGSGEDAKTLAGDPAWDDVNITGRFRITAGNVAAILFRASTVVYEENSGRLFQVENSLASGVSISHTSLGSKTTDASASYKLDRGAWYNFRITVKGTRVDYFINNTAVVNFTNVIYATGQIGLKASKSTCEFDDLAVRDASNVAVFGDDFSSNTDRGWDPRSGTWAFGAGACSMVSAADGRDLALCPVPAPAQSWTARAQLMWTAGTAFETGIVFNYSDAGNNYMVLLSSADSTLRLRRAESGSVTEKWASKSFPVKKGEWYTFTVVFNGTGFGVYVNTALVLNRTDASPLPGTGFGLGSRSTSQERCKFEFFEVFDGEMPPMPDLSVNLSALYVDPARPNPGDTVDIRLNIDNLGTLDAAANYTVELMCNDTQLGIAFPAAIPAGRSVEVWFHWVANLTGNLTLTAAVDRRESIVELDDNNNNASFQLYVNIPPLASIALDPADGKAFVEQAVQFIGTNSSDPDGSVASYLWSFGDRTYASTATAAHVYKADGTYTVGLNVTDNDGASTVAYRTLVVRNRVPSANLTWTPVRGDITTNFTFRYQLYDPDRTLSGLLWDFGDGQNTTDQAPTHRFADDGTYNITFTVVYNGGRERVSFTAVVTVDNIPPKATIVSAPTELRKFQSGQFKACATDPDDRSPLGFSWDFGDGTNASGAEVFHGFNRSGTYRVTFTALDEHGLNSTAFVLVKVPNAPPNASFAGPPPAYLNETFRFDASFSADADGAIMSYSWDFGDGQKGAGVVVTHNYSSPGNYTVRLTVVDEEGANSTAEASVWVREMPSIPRPPAEEKPQSPVAAIGILIVVVFVVVIGILLWSRARRREQPAEAAAQDEQGPGGFQI
jgi:PKD repeat protein